MPIEIRELVIKANVDSNGKSNSASGQGAKSNQNQAAIINACVEKVLEKLKEKSER